MIMQKTPSNALVLSNKLFLLPFLLIIFSRLGIELSVLLIPIELAWIPSFLCYYLGIFLSLRWANKQGIIRLSSISWNLIPTPKLKWFFLGVLLPALIPLNIFLSTWMHVPVMVLLYILIFSLINPFFEELFWRYLMSHLPSNSWIIVLFSSLLFGFTHFALYYPYWFKTNEIVIATVISTFIMGICWMIFYQKERKIMYLIISHILVDIFNLSIAIFYGIDLPGIPN